MNGMLEPIGKHDYPQVEGGLAERATILQRLTRQKVELEERLNKINAALDELKAQPDVARVLELVFKVL